MSTFAAAAHQFIVLVRVALALCLAAPCLVRGRPDAATVERWRDAATARLVEAYGDLDTGLQALNEARTFVLAHPALNEVLAITGLGDHPDLVLFITGLVRKSRPS